MSSLCLPRKIWLPPCAGCHSLSPLLPAPSSAFRPPFPPPPRPSSSQSPTYLHPCQHTSSFSSFPPPLPPAPAEHLFFRGGTSTSRVSGFTSDSRSSRTVSSQRRRYFSRAFQGLEARVGLRWRELSCSLNMCFWIADRGKVSNCWQAILMSSLAGVRRWTTKNAPQGAQ